MSNIRFPQGPISDENGFVTLEWQQWFQNPQFVSFTLPSVLAVSSGGTGIATYTVGDLLYASGSTTLSKLLDVATGNALISGGIATAPSWGKIGLTTHISGTLAIGNGGTNSATALSGSSIMVSDGSKVIQGSAGTSTTVLHGNASGTPTYSAVSLTADVTGTLAVGSGGTGVTTATANTVFAGPTTGAAAAPAFRALVSGDLPATSLSAITNSLSGDVSLNNTGAFFDGPSVAQGTVGTWFASGTVTVTDSTAGGDAFVKLWDGTTVIASTIINGMAANVLYSISLSGYIASPAANIRMSVKDDAHTTGKIIANVSGLSKDSTITALRIG